MNNIIKKFIEDNITKIESEDWMAVLEEWFTNACGQEDVYNVETLTELCFVLKQAGVDFVKETENLMRPFIMNKIQEAFEKELDILDNVLPEFDNIQLFEITYYLYSTFFFTNEQIVSMVDDVARANGLTVEYSGKYVRT